MHKRLQAVGDPFLGVDLDRVRRGDERQGRPIYADRGGYLHVGVDVGDGTVIHFTGEPLQGKGTSVNRTSLDEFAQGGETGWPPLGPGERLHPSLALALAFAHIGLGADRYHPIAGNCEHFALFCTTGVWTSPQVRAAIEEVRAEIGGAGDGWVALGAGLSWALQKLGTVFDWRETKRVRPEAIIGTTAGLVPLYAGEMWEGRGGWWHHRAQVGWWPGDRGPLDRELQASDSGTWVRAWPWQVGCLACRAWDHLACVGIGSRCEAWEETTELDELRLRERVGPWRDNPDTPLGKIGGLADFFGIEPLAGEKLERTLTARAEVWWAVDDRRFRQFLRSADDQWFEVDEPDTRSIPAITVSPLWDRPFDAVLHSQDLGIRSLWTPYSAPDGQDW